MAGIGEPDAANAFTEHFLSVLRGREETPWALEAELHTRWFPEERAHGGFALVREEESVGIGDEPVAVLKTRDLALLLASVLPAAGRDALFRLERQPYAEGFAIQGEFGEVVGHLRNHDPRLVEALHLAACLARSPDALATLLEAAGPTAVERVGRILVRRLAR